MISSTLLDRLAAWSVPAVLISFFSIQIPPNVAAQTPLTDRVLIVYNADLQASIDVANYYQSKRGITPSHMLGIHPSATEGMPGYPDEYLFSKALVEVIAPITNALRQIGPQQILYIVFTYGTPYGVNNDVWPYPATVKTIGSSLDSYVADPFGELNGNPSVYATTIIYANPYCPGTIFNQGLPYLTAGGIDGPVTAIDANNKPVVVPPVTYTPFESLAQFRSRTGMRLYSVFRLDGPNPTIAMQQVDKAIQAEQAGGLDHMGGKAYFDRRNTDAALTTNFPPRDHDHAVEWMIYRARLLAVNAGLPYAEENTYRRLGEPASDVPSAPNAILYFGTYGQYNTRDVNGNPQPDPWGWLPGAIGMEYHSNSMLGGPRGDNNKPPVNNSFIGWGPGAIAAGITACTGTVSEPGTAGPAHGDALFRTLFEGANIGDAFFRDDYFIGAFRLNVGDPLYTPFPGGRGPYRNPVSDTIPPTVSLTAPANDQTVAGSVTVSAAASDNVGVVGVQFKLDGANLGTEITNPPYAASWDTSLSTSGPHALTATARDGAGNSTASKTFTVIVAAPNIPPAVSLAGPANNSVWTAPANVTISASAADSDGSISKVEFYQGTTLLGSVASAPFTFDWFGVSAGLYTLTAEATDNLGAVTASSPISIEVNPGPNQPPTVMIVNPLDGAAFTPPATFTILALASDPDGTLTKVEFFDGPTLLATSTSPPNAFTWQNVPTGIYFISATATDNLNATATSPPIRIIVEPLPVITISQQGGSEIISWTGLGTLESADTVTGPWTPVPGATTPYLVPATGLAKFFRVKG